MTQVSSAPMIGETAGRVWSYLGKNGEASMWLQET